MTVSPTAGSGRLQRLALERRTARLRRDGRRDPRRRGQAGLPASWVESARVRLLEQRSFRLAQLEELAPDEGAQVGEGGPTEVRDALRGAAEAALADVDAALRRMEQGTYGRCARCAAMVSRSRLEAVPSAPLCWTCHLALDVSRRTPVP